MARQLVTVCILCLLCATHAQCGGSRGISSSVDFSAPQELRPLRTRRASISYGHRIRRDLPPTDHDPVSQNSHLDPVLAQENDNGDIELQLRRIFAEFGDPTRMTLNFKEFTRLVQSGRLRPMSLAPTSNQNSNSSESTTTSSVSNSNSLKTAIEIPHVHQENPPIWQCLQPREFLGKYGVENDVITPPVILQMCPTLLAYIFAPMNQEKVGSCLMVPSQSSSSKEHGGGGDDDEEDVSGGTSVKVWLCATGSIVVVSLCGLLGVGVIPFMQRVFYQQLLQFLVALAVGTLCGDALLHLLPHAILGPETHGHGYSHSHSGGHVHGVELVQHELEEYNQHTAAVWRGFVACMGLIFFFVTEKCLTLVAEWRKRRQRRAHPAGGHRHRVKVMREIGGPTRNNSRDGCTANGNSNSANNGRGDSGLDADDTVIARSGKQCKHKYSSYPYCYGEISDVAEIPASGEAEGLTATTRLPSENVPCCVEELKVPVRPGGETLEAPDVPADMHPSECESYTVIIREHETSHHGHSHAHGHVHAAPRTMSSVAWMVVMGDGLHNLTDGVAIGAAFAAGLPGGFSTALAVLCHELPHELGDFAVLLKAGMSLKQAVFYNVLSSLLCLFGMLFGVALGHSPTATPLVFAAAAGMFLYIALVDMIPELSSNHSQEGGSVCQCVLQVLGMLSGTGVMLLIALYEHDLKSVFSEGAENH